METEKTPLVLVIVVGPQASGKSTFAAALSAESRRRGERVALVELDDIAAMALPSLPSWEAAHHVFEAVTGLWARTDLTSVIAEGSGSRDEVSRLEMQAPPGAVVITVATTVDFETALSRAQLDPTRGVSRERDFLSHVYDLWAEELGLIDADVVVDTGVLSVDEAVAHVSALIDTARLARPR